MFFFFSLSFSLSFLPPTLGLRAVTKQNTQQILRANKSREREVDKEVDDVFLGSFDIHVCGKKPRAQVKTRDLYE